MNSWRIWRTVLAISMVVAVLHRLKLDPKIAAGPVSLAAADIFTLLVYLNLATFVL